jgi:hypothetical protein
MRTFEKSFSRISRNRHARPWLVNVPVNDGIVDLWSVARSDAERTANRVAAESLQGVRAVNDNLVIGHGDVERRRDLVASAAVPPGQQAGPHLFCL